MNIMSEALPISRTEIDGTSEEDATELVKNSILYKEFFAEREEILRHKWIESEKAEAILVLNTRCSIGL